MSASPPPPPAASGAFPPPSFNPRANRRAWKLQARLERDRLKQQQWLRRQQFRAMRRYSLVGPVLLLLSGVFFLLIETGRISGARAAVWYGTWWPLLLIGSGVLLLAEWLLNGRRGAVLGGGMVTLLILLASLGWTANAAHNSRILIRDNFGNHWDFIGETHQADSTLSNPSSPNGTLLIHNPRGDVSVTGGSDDGQVHVSVHKELRYFGLTDLAQRLDALQPRFTGSPDALELSVTGNGGGHADLQVTVPRGTGITVDAERGSVTVAEIHAPVTLSAASGDVSLSGIDGPVTTHLRNRNGEFSAHSVQGAVAVDGRGGDLNFSDITGPVSMDGEFFGSTHLEHVNGSVSFQTFRTTLRLVRLDGHLDISSGSDAPLDGEAILGPVILHTSNRVITLERVQGDIQIENSHGPVSTSSAGPVEAISIQNRGGSVSVGLPATGSFTVNARTHDGTIQNDFGLNSANDGDRPVLTGTVGRGGPAITLETSDGDVTLRKFSAEPLPAILPTAPPVHVDQNFPSDQLGPKIEKSPTGKHPRSA